MKVAAIKLKNYFGMLNSMAFSTIFLRLKIGSLCAFACSGGSYDKMNQSSQRTAITYSITVLACEILSLFMNWNLHWFSPVLTPHSITPDSEEFFVHNINGYISVTMSADPGDMWVFSFLNPIVVLVIELCRFPLIFHSILLSDLWFLCL